MINTGFALIQDGRSEFGLYLGDHQYGPIVHPNTQHSA
jgi:hypothetical protein